MAGVPKKQECIIYNIVVDYIWKVRKREISRMNIRFLLFVGGGMVKSFRDQRNTEDQTEDRENGKSWISNIAIFLLVFDIFFNFFILVKYTEHKI